MSNNIPAPADSVTIDVRAEAHRWVRRKRILYTILAIYAVLSLMWFAIDMADGTENLWFYWPMLGTGVVVAITSVVLVGVGGPFGAEWEQRRSIATSSGTAEGTGPASAVATVGGSRACISGPCVRTGDGDTTPCSTPSRRAGGRCRRLPPPRRAGVRAGARHT